MKNVRSESRYITEQDVKEFGKLVKREDDKHMAWILLVELITYINNDEKKFLEQTVEKAKKNPFLKKDEEFMRKLNKHFSKNDIQYLKRLKENIKS